MPLWKQPATMPDVVALFGEARVQLKRQTANRPVDMARVYFHAVRRKMERELETGRTFSSSADKLYFLCELSWEMLSKDPPLAKLDYRDFPDRLRQLFPSAVGKAKDLD